MPYCPGAQNPGSSERYLTGSGDLRQSRRSTGKGFGFSVPFRSQSGVGSLNGSLRGVSQKASATVGAPVPVGTPIYTVNTRNSTNFRGDIVRVGLNYKLGGPVVAKY